MSFFYDLNKKLDSIRATPEVTHQQLNERSMSRAAKGIEKYTKPGMEELSRLGREGASEKKMDAARAKYDQYDESVNESAAAGYDPEMQARIKTATPQQLAQMAQELAGGAGPRYNSELKMLQQAQSELSGQMGEGAHSQDAMALNPDFDKIGRKPGVMDRVARGAKNLADVLAPGDDELLDRLEKSSGHHQPRQPRTKEPRYMEAMSPAKQKSFAALAPPTDKITFADKIAGAKKEVDEMLGDVAAEAMKKALGGGRGREQEMDEAAGSIDYDKVLEAIAALYGDDIYDNDAMQDLANDLEQAGPTDRELDFIIAKGKLPKRLAGIQFSAGDSVQFDEASTGNAFDYKSPREPEAQKSGSRIHKGTYGTEYDGDKDDAKALRTKKKAAADTGQVQRGRGRPKNNADSETGQVMKPDFGAFGVTGKDIKLPKHKGAVTKHKMVGEDDLDPKDQGEYDQEGDMAKDTIKTVVRHAQALEKILGDNDNLPEWVQSKLAKIEGMMTAVDDYMQNQETDQDDDTMQEASFSVPPGYPAFKKKKPPAPTQDNKVAKTMKKGDAEDFASTKHKGLPEKAAKKNKEEDVEESTTSGSVATSAAAPKAAKGAGGFTFGKGIYDSMNRELEGMIAESMSINMSMNNDDHGGPTRSLTVTATDEDATRLAQLLKSAGLGGDSGSQGTCSVCGGSNCGCNTMDENYGVNEVSQNTPDYPTNTETAQDNFEYSGGLNKPKSTGQTTVPVIAGQSGRTGSYAESEQDALQRMMEMSGIREAKAKPDFLDMDKDGDKQEPMKKAVDDKKVKVDEADTEFAESIQRMREIAGLDKKTVDEEKTEEGNLFTKGLKDDNVKVGDKIPGTNATKTKDIDESIFTLTNQWRAYKG